MLYYTSKKEAVNFRAADTKRGIKLRKTSYKKLWKLLIDKEINKTTLARMANVSTSTMTKITKGESVNMDIIVRLCNTLDCEIQDIVELVPDSENALEHTEE